MDEVARLGPKSILLVDDDPTVARAFRRQLEKLGYAVHTEGDPEEAARVFGADPAAFDLLLTDLGMPGLEGTELARVVHAIRPDLPILLATGSKDDVDPREARDAGVVAVLQKPLTMDELHEAVAAALGAR